MFHTVTLEVSLKPFRDTDEASVREIARQICRQWYGLLKNRRGISFMLWTGDGSELLDYRGRLSDSFEWGYFIGTANLPLVSPQDRPDRSIHERKYLYTDKPAVITYEILKRIVTCLKEEASAIFPHAKITVGETLDIGPEFAVSDFKYNRHREIISGDRLDGFGMLDATSLLKGDDCDYAAFPGGIPDKTPFGYFLGRQSEVFLKDMGFDYLWLSNGLGFSDNPWQQEGKIYDGKQFYPQRLEKTANGVFTFWREFRRGCPLVPVMTRGTNNSVGIDYATDGVPLYDIYRGDFHITPPPNSPWAALNDNFGLELMGHMTRICELPGKEYLFRYYIHDPWWVNSPWYDRYDNNPHDIYLPLAVTRIDEDGRTRSAELFNILSIDNSFGHMPDCCVYEPLPHLLKAEKEAPDSPAPFVWVYPMQEYTTGHEVSALEDMYFGDRLVMNGINAGFPLNCVVSTGNFRKHPLSLYAGSILLMDLTAFRSVKEQAEAFLERGGRILLYGKKEPNNSQRKGIQFISYTQTGEALLSAVVNCGYEILHEKADAKSKAPTMTIARYKNGLSFSVYNTNTTTETLLRFPLGAPILMTGETRIINGYASYRFARSEHRECRIFVRQEGGCVGAREMTPIHPNIHRRFRITGLQDATVCYFPETDYVDNARVGSGRTGGDITPVYDQGWVKITDENGTYYKAEHITGDKCFYMPRCRMPD